MGHKAGTAKGGWKHLAFLAAPLSLALALRLWRITAQSFWFDEGWTSWAISRSWSAMFDLLARDNHPPLYFTLLRLWAAVFGSSDLALRGFSALADLGTVAILFALGRRFWNPVVGFLAALVAAVSPPLVMYAQEARMYASLACLVALATYSLGRLAESDRPVQRRWLGLYLVSMAAALYTHHEAWLAFGAQMLFALALGIARRQKGPLIGGLLVILLYLPCLPLTIRQLVTARGMTWKPLLQPQQVLRDFWLFLNLGNAWQSGAVPRITWGPLFLIAAGLGLGWRSSPRNWLLLAFSLALPVLLTCAIASRVAFYVARYLLFVAPFYYLLLAVGAWEVVSLFPQRIRWAAAPALALLLATVALPMGRELVRYYRGQGPLKADFRAVAAHIEGAARPGDGLALVQTAPAFLHYYRGDLAWEAFPSISMEDYVSSEEEVARKLKAIARPGAVVWWVGYDQNVADPQNLVEAQLREHGNYWDEAWWHATQAQQPIRVAAYVIKDTGFGPEPRTPVGANFKGQLELTDYHIQRDWKGNIFVALWWKVLAKPDRDFIAFVHLLDSDGKIIAQGDRIPMNNLFPVSRWRPGQIWRDEHKLKVSKDLDLSQCQLRLGLCWGEKGENQLEIIAGPGKGEPFLIVPAQSSPW